MMQEDLDVLGVLKDEEHHKISPKGLSFSPDW
jgi:hypothetical protein